MFAKTIIDSDAFLDMPLSAQAMYFHLSMRADDEGFVNNPKKIQRMIGGSDDDLKLLIAKNFIIPFDSGVVVIKHWRIHNYIRSDRLVETKYKDEKSLLELKENGAYTFSSDLQEVEQMDYNDVRKIAYKNSTLPYSFSYKIKRAFDGKVCPVCGKKMATGYRTLIPTIQHNKPISKGGVHELGNISVICNSCNARIRNNETDELNNAEVVEVWDKIVTAERLGIKWFWNPEVLENIDVSQMSVTCQSNVSIGKDSIGKDSIGKDSIDKDSIEYLDDSKESSFHLEEEQSNSKTMYQWLVEAWNELEPYGISTVRKITSDSKRAKMVGSRLKSYSKEEILEAIDKIKTSDFLLGRETNFVINFDWFIKPNNFPKVLDGNYDNNRNVTSQSRRGKDFSAELEYSAGWAGRRENKT